MANPYFNAEYYLSQNPDVFAAGINTAEAAWEHYVNFGAAEALNGAASRKPAPWFDIAFYLADNPDLNTAGLTAGQLLDHFTNFGISEGRSPNAEDNVDAATMSAYAVANPDLVEAFDIEDPTDLTDDEVTALAQHFYAFGYDEGRPGLPYDPSDLDPDPNDGQTFTLTTAVGEVVVGTTGDDTFRAVAGDSVEANRTLNISDSIDGGAGTDTLNLVMTAGSAMAAGVSIKNVEIVNLDVSAASASADFLNSAKYEGVTQLWQVQSDSVGSGANFNNVTVSEGVAAGFRGNNASGSGASGAADVLATVSGSATQKVLTVALDGVGDGSTIVASGAKLETLDLSGSIAKASGSTAGTLNFDIGGTVTTVNGDFTSDLTLNFSGYASGDKLKVVDLSDSSGGVTMDVSASGTFATLETVKGGAGADKLTVDLSIGSTKLATVDLGAGNDTLTLNATASNSAPANKAVSVTLGDGKDAIKLDGGVGVTNVQDTADLTKGLVTVEDFTLGEDTLYLGGSGTVLTGDVLAEAAGKDSLKAAAEVAIVAIEAGSSKNAAIFNWEGDAYVVVNTVPGTGGTLDVGDGLIKLAGLDATQLSVDQGGGLVL